MSQQVLCYQNHSNCCLIPEHLRLLADKTVAEWRRILSLLGVDDNIIRTVEEDALNRRYHHDSREIAYQGYLMWKNIAPQKASFCLLTEVLDKAQRNDINEELKEYYQFQSERNIHSLHPAPVNYFVGREKEINSIIEFSQSTNNNKLLLIYGLPGVGKSELVQQSIRLIRKDTRSLEIIKPLFPSNHGDARWGLEDVASSILAELQPVQCHINHRVATLHKLLLSTSKPMLLILELSGISFKQNANQILWSFLDGLLRSDNEHLKIIATSCKNPDINQMQHLHIDEIHLKGLEMNDVIKLMQNMNPTLTIEYCQKIYEVCGSNPFILRKLGAHIKNFGRSTKELDELLLSLESRKNLEALQPLISQTILKSDMKIVFDDLEPVEKETLVQLCGFHDIIPVDALLHIFGEKCHNRCKHLCTNHCIIERSSSGAYFKMNLLTCSFICEYAESDKSLCAILKHAKESVVKYYLQLLEDLDEVYFWATNYKKRVHISHLIHHCQENCKVCPTNQCKCSIPKVVQYIFQTQKSLIMRSLQQGLQSQTKLFDATVNTCSKTVHFLRNVVCYEDLHELFDEIFVQLDKINDKVRLAITMANLVFIKIYHKVTAEKHENIEYLKKSINFLEKNNMFQDIPDVLVSCYCNRGYLKGFYSSEYVQGVRDIQKARDILKSLPETNRRKIAELTVCGYMSAILYRNKDYSASILERKRQIVGYREFLGVHPYTAKTLNYQGQAYAKLGKFHEAITCCLASYEIVKQLNGEGFETMRVLSTYGKVLLKAGNVRRGIEKLEYALEVGEKTLGEHDVTAWCYEQLADEQFHQGCNLKAEELKSKATAIRRHFAMKSQSSNRKTYSLQLSRDELTRYSFMVPVVEPNDMYIPVIFICMVFALMWRVFEIYLQCSNDWKY